MSSIHAAKSQVAPFKFYTTEITNSGLIYDDAGNNAVTVPANTTLRDMGKTVVLADGTVLRKVQVLPVTVGTTGYIYLNSAPAGQNIVTLN